MDINLIALTAQSRIFGDFSSFQPTSDLTISLITRFKEYKLLPSTIIEDQFMKQTPRLRFSSIDSEYVLFIGNEFIDFFHNKIDTKEFDINTFISESCDVFKSIYDEGAQPSSRLVFSLINYIKDFDESKKRAFLENFPNPINYYSDNKPFEWSYRFVVRDIMEINGQKEKLNIITTLTQSDITNILNGYYTLIWAIIPELENHSSV